MKRPTAAPDDDRPSAPRPVSGRPWLTDQSWRAKELISSVDIDAPKELVWRALTDFEDFPSWNPFITRAEGVLATGERLSLVMQPAHGSAVTLRPTVVELEQEARLRWKGRLFVPGIFDAEHLFVLETRAGGGSRLIQSEQFSGLLVLLLSGSLDRGTLPAFHAMNAALKNRVEEAR